jgi:zinc protease
MREDASNQQEHRTRGQQDVIHEDPVVHRHRILRMDAVVPMIATALACSDVGAGTPQRPLGIVLASPECMGDPAWAEVANAAARARGWALATCGPEGLAGALSPDGAECAIVVAMPGEAGRASCAAWQRAFRAIDADPFEDASWGIVTGPSPEVAMRIAARTEPVVLASALGTTPLPASGFTRAMWFSEGVQGEVHRLVPGKEWVVESRGAEQSRAFAEEWSADWADFVFTSGRSNEMRWLLGYSYPSGRVVPRRGELWARDLDGVETPIRSMRSKAMLAAGNCLMAHLRDADSLSMALLDAGGVDQLAGYTSVTWDGRAGWGCARWLLDEPGRWSLAEAVQWSRQELLARMQRDHPGDLSLIVEAFDRSARTDFEAACAARMADERAEVRLARLGALWDRDAFILVGDPARRMAPADGARRWEGGLAWRDGEPWFEVRALTDRPPEAPPAIHVPRDARGRVVPRNDGPWCVADSFVMLLEPGEWKVGRCWSVPLWRPAGYASEPTKGTR